MPMMSGKRTVTAAGTAVPLTAVNQEIQGPLIVKALIANTGTIYIGNDGASDVASTNGLELKAGEVVVFEFCGQTHNIFIDSSVNGEGVSWLCLEI